MARDTVNTDFWDMEVEPNSSLNFLFEEEKIQPPTDFLDIFFDFSMQVESEDPMGIDALFCLSEKEEEPFGLEELFKKQKKNFLERMEIDELVHDYQSSESWVDSIIGNQPQTQKRKKPWTQQEETMLYRFIQTYRGHKVPTEAWKRIARRLGRTVCSVHSKAVKLRRNGLQNVQQERKVNPCRRRACLHTLIHKALEYLPNKQGTKPQIIAAIKSQEGIEEGTWVTSVKQLLNKYRKISKTFCLAPGTMVKATDLCQSMTDYIIWSLKDGHLNLEQLKSKISYHFGKWLNLSITADSELKTWEKTLLKKLGN